MPIRIGVFRQRVDIQPFAGDVDHRGIVIGDRRLVGEDGVGVGVGASEPVGDGVVTV